MDVEPPKSAGSKRKRTFEWAMTVPIVDRDMRVEAGDDNSITPKRSRQSDWSSNDRSSPPKQEQKSVRRKHARYGLSSLNKRQAQAQTQQQQQIEALKTSRFQEGSMSDKPSAQPPSVFTRDNSHPALPALANVDHLMSQYHDGDLSQSVPDEETIPEHTAVDFSVDGSQKPSSSLFRFGRMLTSSFNPANVWGSFSRTWKESKEDLTVRNIEENRKRQQQKELVEQKYQELKKSGAFTFTIVGNPNNTIRSPHQRTIHSPRQYTAVRDEHVYDHEQNDRKYHTVVPARNVSHDRDISKDSAAAVIPPPQLASIFNRPSSPLPPPETQHHHQSHRHLQTQTQTQTQSHPRPEPQSESRFPAQSQSPEKPLKQRKSFFSLRAPSLNNLKRGRSDYSLSTAFVRNSTASPEKVPPLPHLPHLTLPRSNSKKDLNKQVKLSKRVSNLEAKLADARRELNTAITNTSPLPPLPSRFEKYTPTPKQSLRSRFGLGGRLPSLPSESLLFEGQQVQDTPTVRHRPFHHSKSVDFNSLRDSAVIIDTPRSENPGLDFAPSSDYAVPMDPATLASSEPFNHGEEEVAERPSLDERLRALDASVKLKSKKSSSSSKKRKSTSKDDDTLYKPSKYEEDDDYDIVVEKPKKKRKSTGKKATNNTKAGHSERDQNKHQAHASEEPEMTAAEYLRSIEQPLQPPVQPKQHVEVEILVPARQPEPEPDVEAGASRSSLEDPLDPIYEEDTIVVASRPPLSRSKSTSARFRSASPNKRPSPPPSTNCSKPNIVVEDHVSVIPGVSSVPDLPSNTVTAKRHGDKDRNKEQWDWPEDVF